MTSTGGPEAELHIPSRLELLQALNDALPADAIQPTAWACLWLAEVDKPRELLTLAQKMPNIALGYFSSLETNARIVPTCRMIKLVLSR
jgi:hypothetical protein